MYKNLYIYKNQDSIKTARMSLHPALKEAFELCNSASLTSLKVYENEHAGRFDSRACMSESKELPPPAAQVRPTTRSLNIRRERRLHRRVGHIC